MTKIYFSPDEEYLAKLPKSERKAQRQAWEKIEREIDDAFTAQPKPNTKVLRYHIEHIQDVRPAFRATLTRMLQHPACQ